MQRKVQRLQPLVKARTTLTEKNVTYHCAACGIGFMDYPLLPVEWPEPGQGLPAHCDNPDCHEYLVQLSTMREWMAKSGTADYMATDGKRYTLTGQAAVAKRVAERREMVARDAEGWR